MAKSELADIVSSVEGVIRPTDTEVFKARFKLLPIRPLIQFPRGALQFLQVRYSASYAKSARERTPLGSTSYARGYVVRGFDRLANEIFDLLGVAPVTA